MKKTQLLKILVLIAVLLLGSTQSEAKKRTRGGKARSRTTAVTVKRGAEETIAGITFQTFSCKKGESEISILYPVSGPSAVVTAIRSSIDNSLTSASSPEAWIKKTMSNVGPGKESLQYTSKTSVEYSNDNAITILDEGYDYMGGAHGMPWSNSTTFRLSDGKVLTEEMLPSISVLRPLILDGLAESYDTSVSGLSDVLFGSSSELPMGAPSVVKGGLQIKYTPYEIAPFAAGIPTAVIPFSKIKSKLSKQALSFF